MSKPAGDSPADPKTDPPAGDPPKADPPKSDPPKSDPPADPKPKGEKSYSKAEADAIAKKAVEDAQKKWESEKDLTELERIKKENEELRSANRLRDAKDEVVAALAAAGNKSPELAFRAIQGDLKFDEKTGKLLNAKDLIDGFKTSYPEQFGTEKPGQGIDGGAGQGQGGAKLTKEAIEKMTTDEINKNWAEVSKVLAAS